MIACVVVYVYQVSGTIVETSGFQPSSNPIHIVTVVLSLQYSPQSPSPSILSSHLLVFVFTIKRPCSERMIYLLYSVYVVLCVWVTFDLYPLVWPQWRSWCSIILPAGRQSRCHPVRRPSFSGAKKARSTTLFRHQRPKIAVNTTSVAEPGLMGRSQFDTGSPIPAQEKKKSSSKTHYN